VVRTWPDGRHPSLRDHGTAWEGWVVRMLCSGGQISDEDGLSGFRQSKFLLARTDSAGGWRPGLRFWISDLARLAVGLEVHREDREHDEGSLEVSVPS
jgi:hypothetical protein